MPSVILSAYRDVVREILTLVEDPGRIAVSQLIVRLYESASILGKIPPIPTLYTATPLNFIALRAMLHQMCGEVANTLKRDHAEFLGEEQNQGLHKAIFDYVVTDKKGKKSAVAGPVDDRIGIAHGLNLKHLLAEYASSAAQYAQEIEKLATLAKACLDEGFNTRLLTAEAVAAAAAEPILGSTVTVASMVPSSVSNPSDEPDERECLTNIIEAIGTIEEVLAGATVNLGESLPNQALVALGIQVVGNNLNRLKKLKRPLGITDPIFFVKKRNFFAHAYSLSARFESPIIQWTTLPEVYGKLKLSLDARLTALPAPPSMARSDIDDDDRETPSPKSPGAPASAAVVNMPAPARASGVETEKKEEKAPTTETSSPAVAEQSASGLFSNADIKKLEQTFKMIQNGLYSSDMTEYSKRIRRLKRSSLIDYPLTFRAPGKASPIERSDGVVTHRFVRRSGKLEYTIPAQSRTQFPPQISFPAIGFAALQDQDKAFKDLLDSGANPNVELPWLTLNSKTRPLLFKAVESSAIEIETLELLLENGADVNAVASNGMHVLEMINANGPSTLRERADIWQTVREGRLGSLKSSYLGKGKSVGDMIEENRAQILRRVRILLQYGADPLKLTTLKVDNKELTALKVKNKLKIPVIASWFLDKANDSELQLMVLKEFIKWIARNDGIEKLGSLFKIGISIIHKRKVETIPVATLIANRDSHIPENCRLFLCQLQQSLAIYNPLLPAIFSGRVEEVQLILPGITNADLLKKAAGLAAVIGYKDMVTCLMGRIRSNLTSQSTSSASSSSGSSSSPAVPAPEVNAPAIGASVPAPAKGSSAGSGAHQSVGSVGSSVDPALPPFSVSPTPLNTAAALASSSATSSASSSSR